MNLSRIVLFITVLMIIISSLSIVSAGIFDLGGNDNNVNGINFNIPEGFSKQNTTNENNSIKAYFSNGTTPLTIIVHNPDSNINEERFNNNFSNMFDTYQKKNISGHNGFMMDSKKYHRTYFTYLNDNQIVEINAPNEKIISKLIK